MITQVHVSVWSYTLLASIVSLFALLGGYFYLRIRRTSETLGPLVVPGASGRLVTLVEATKGANLLFPYLRRRLEGFALRAVGPLTEVVPASDGSGSLAVVSLSGNVTEVVEPPRWPREVLRVGRDVFRGISTIFSVYFIIYNVQLDVLVLLLLELFVCY